MTRSIIAAPLFALLLAAAACGGAAEQEGSPDPTAAPTAAPTTAAAEGTTYVGVEYEFQGEDQLASGQQTITLENGGEQPHELQLMLLEEGRTSADIEALFEADDPSQGIPEWVTQVGGTYTDVGETASFDAELEAGTYAMVCFIPDEDGVPHAAKGMIKQVTVA